MFPLQCFFDESINSNNGHSTSNFQTSDSLETNATGLKLPNKPTIESAKRMRKMLRDRLALYKGIKCEIHDDHIQDLPWTHIAARMFLCSEKSLLSSLVNHVRDIQSELEDEEL